MARKRVNKNLVAFLTIMGILLTVVVVFIATSAGAGKDPEEWARRARDQADAGDYEFAIRLFDRAYRSSRESFGGHDVTYLVEAAQCAYQFGDIGRALQTLDKAHGEQPSNEDAIVAYLDIMWDLYQPEVYWRLRPQRRNDILEYAEAMQEVDADNVLGPVSEAVARLGNEDAEESGGSTESAGYAALQRAIDLDEHDPRVVLTRLRWGLRQLQRGIQAAQARGASNAEVEELTQQYRDESQALLTAAVEAHPESWRLVEAQVGELRGQGLADEARALLERTVAENPDDPKVRAGLAEFLLSEARRTRAELSPEAYVEMMDEAEAYARQAIALEPAMYAAYVVVAQVALARDAKGAGAEAITPESYEAALRVYDEAIRTTVGVRSLEAARGELLRQLMYVRAFNTAIAFYDGATTPEEREKRVKWVHSMLAPSRSRYPDAAFTHYMQAQMHLVVENELLLAIREFERAEELARTDAFGLYPRMWIEGFNGVLPLERLALLYRQHNQPGEALDRTEEAIAQYLELGRRGLRVNQVSLLKLVLNRAELLNILGRYQEASDYVDEIGRQPDLKELLARRAADRQRLAAAKASALQNLGQPQRAEDVLAEAGGASASGLLMQAQLALMQEDYESAEQRVRSALADDDLTAALATQCLHILMPLLAEAGRQDEAKQILADLRRRLGDDERFAGLLDRYDVVVSYRDPQEREAKWLELISAEPDPVARAGSLYQYYLGQGKLAQAAAYLDELERALPDDTGVLERQFRLALRREQFDRATQYCVRLTQLDADHAGGAMLRGELALAQNQWADAVREFREALTKLPRTCALQVTLARALLGANRIDEAVEALKEAVKLNPQHFGANKLLYIAYQLLPPADRPDDDGLSYLRKAAELRPSDPFVKEREDFLNPQAAITRREQQRSAEPGNVENLIRLAQLYANEDDVPHASQRFAEALDIEPGNQFLAQAAADFYARTDQRAAGEQHLRRFLDALSGRALVEGYILLARYYARWDDVEAVEAAYHAAQSVLAEQVTDPAEQRAGMLAVMFDLIELYQRYKGHEQELAETCREALLKLDAEKPEDAAMVQRARFALVQAKLRLGRLGEADEELAAYQEAYPEDVRGLIARAQLKLAQMKWEEADEALSAVLRQLPDHVWSLLTRGDLSVRCGDYVEAEKDLTRAKSLVLAQRDRRPNDSDVQLQMNVCSELAGLYEITEQYELAEAELRGLLELLEDRPDAGQQTQLLADRLVRLYGRAGRPDKARQVVSEFMARHPNAPYWPYRLALLCMERGNELERQSKAARADGRSAEADRQARESQSQYQTAVSYLQTAEQMAARQDPEFALQAFAYQLDALAAGGQADRAAELFEQRRSNVEQMPAIVFAAAIRAYELQDRRADALRLLGEGLEAAARKSAGTVRAVLGLARVQLPATEVTDVLRTVTAGLPEDSLIGQRMRIVLAGQLLAAGDVPGAERSLDQVSAQAAPGSAEQRLSLLLRSRALDAAGDPEGAVRTLQQGLEDYPNDVQLMNNLAYVLTDRLGRHVEALKYAEQASQADPRNASFQDTLGWVYFKNGNYGYAEAALKRALSVAPDSLAANLHLGLLCADRGRRGEARTRLLRALQLAQNEGDQEYERKAQEALDQLP